VDFYGITSLRPEWPIIGSFGLKFFPSGFENSLMRSNLRPSNARSELFSDRNGNRSAGRLGADGQDLAKARPAITEKPLL